MHWPLVFSIHLLSNLIELFFLLSGLDHGAREWWLIAAQLGWLHSTLVILHLLAWFGGDWAYFDLPRIGLDCYHRLVL